MCLEVTEENTKMKSVFTILICIEIAYNKQFSITEIKTVSLLNLITYLKFVRNGLMT